MQTQQRRSPLSWELLMGLECPEENVLQLYTHVGMRLIAAPASPRTQFLVHYTTRTVLTRNIPIYLRLPTSARDNSIC